MAPVTQVRTCAHPGCKCLVSEDTEYCSPYCKDNAGAARAKYVLAKDAAKHEHCGCGHPSCESDVAVDPRQKTAA